MVTQLSTTYYQAYKLAYDLAKRAERCYRYEHGIPASSYIQYGYWDNLRKGLLAGEQLALDLQRLDAADLENARRDHEIVRQVSLVLHDPHAFMRLRETGECEVAFPEELFDADYPGHYFRRLKMVSLTLPCVSGPYTPINCTLTLLASHVRISPSSAGSYPEQDAPNDPRFSHDYGAVQRVATSHGQNDAGLFEVSFRDERYLPFEGAGAISRWRLELPKDCNPFDFDSLSDAVFKLAYTARDGGAPLARAARISLSERRATAVSGEDGGVTGTTPLVRLFRVRYEFSDAWIAFKNASERGSATLSLVIDRDRFPYLFRAVPLSIVGLRLYATASAPLDPFALELAVPGGEPSGSIALESSRSDPSVLHSETRQVEVEVGAGADASWSFTAPAGAPLGAVRDLVVLVTYTAATTRPA